MISCTLRAARAPGCALHFCSRRFCRVLKQIYLRCSLAQRGFGILMTACQGSASSFSYSELLQVLLSLDRTTINTPRLCCNPGHSVTCTNPTATGWQLLSKRSQHQLAGSRNQSQPLQSQTGFLFLHTFAALETLIAAIKAAPGRRAVLKPKLGCVALTWGQQPELERCPARRSRAQGCACCCTNPAGTAAAKRPF